MHRTDVLVSPYILIGSPSHVDVEDYLGEAAGFQYPLMYPNDRSLLYLK